MEAYYFFPSIILPLAKPVNVLKSNPMGGGGKK